MSLFFPDLNVWIALSLADHPHNADVWNWLGNLPPDGAVIFSRYTQVGLLRLLTTHAVMGDLTLTIRKAWAVYDDWLSDPRVEFHPEPRGVGDGFREATKPFAGQSASKMIGDCYLLAFAKHSSATLLTFDQGLLTLAKKQGLAAVRPR